MKKTIFALMCMAGFTMMSACGGKDNKGAAENTTAENQPTTEQVTDEQEPAATETESNDTPDFATFAEQVKEICGVAPFTTDEMSDVKARIEESEERGKEYCVYASVADDIDKEAVQREYFNAFAKAADGGNIYGFHMNGTRGTDAFKDYDEYVKFIKENGDYAKAIYGYDYNGKPIKVYCAISFGDFGLTVSEK